MLLYHISDKRHSNLKPLRLQGKSYRELEQLDKKYKEPLTPGYTWSLSFFFDPPPYNEFPKHYDVSDRWVPGSKVYEHTVDVMNLPSSMYWRVVETPINRVLGGELWNQIDEKLWFKTRWELLAATGHMGFGFDGLMNVINKYKGTTEEYFQQLWKSPDFHNVKDHYAPNVPHLMLWSEQPIVVSQIRDITIPVQDSDIRTNDHGIMVKTIRIRN